MKRLIFLILFLFLVVPAGAAETVSKEIPKPKKDAPAADRYDSTWSQIKAACDRCYSGIEFFEVSGVENRIPRLSKDEREKAQANRKAFLLEAAAILSEIERNEDQIGVLEESLKLKGQTAGEDGSGLIDSLMKIKGDLATARALLNQNRRKLEAFLLCGKKLE